MADEKQLSTHLSRNDGIVASLGGMLMQQQELAEDISISGFAKKTLDLMVYVFGDDS